MKHQEPGRRIRIYVGESGQWHGRTLYSAIVQEARKRGMAGATVARGVMGFAGAGVVHESHLLLGQVRPDRPGGYGGGDRRRPPDLVGGRAVGARHPRAQTGVGRVGLSTAARTERKDRA